MVLPVPSGPSSTIPGGWLRRVVELVQALASRQAGGAVNDGRKPTPCSRVLFGDGRRDAAELAVLQPVGVALEGDDFGVVDEPVDHRGGDGVVAEDLAPAGEVLVAGDDQAGSFVAGEDQLEEQVGRFRFEGM